MIGLHSRQCSDDTLHPRRIKAGTDTLKEGRGFGTSNYQTIVGDGSRHYGKWPYSGYNLKLKAQGLSDVG